MLPSTASSTFPPSPTHGCRQGKFEIEEEGRTFQWDEPKAAKTSPRLPLTYGKPKEIPDPIPYPCLGGTFFLLLGQGMNPKEMTTFCHATRCHTLGAIIWPSKRKKLVLTQTDPIVETDPWLFLFVLKRVIWVYIAFQHEWNSYGYQLRACKIGSHAYFIRVATLWQPIVP